MSHRVRVAEQHPERRRGVTGATRGPRARKGRDTIVHAPGTVSCGQSQRSRTGIPLILQPHRSEPASVCVFAHRPVHKIYPLLRSLSPFNPPIARDTTTREIACWPSSPKPCTQTGKGRARGRAVTMGSRRVNVDREVADALSRRVVRSVPLE